MYISVHSSIIYNQKLETTQIQIVYREINYSMSTLWNVSSNRKEQTTGTCTNMDESWKHYSKWEKPDMRVIEWWCDGDGKMGKREHFEVMEFTWLWYWLHNYMQLLISNCLFKVGQFIVHKLYLKELRRYIQEKCAKSD